MSGMAFLADPHAWVSFLTLTALEIILGIDNLVFLTLLASRLPEARREAARKIGLFLALGTRLVLLGSIAWLTRLTAPVLSLAGQSFSWRDLILIGGGAFLLFKSTLEIHRGMEEKETTPVSGRPAVSFTGTVAQIAILDIVFSLDSVITAVGIADHLWVMASAIVMAMAVMLLASNPLATFIEHNASVKMLALAFLLLIGMVLVTDGFGFHVPRGYIYTAMGFSVLVESLNLLMTRRRRLKREHARMNEGTLTETPR